MSATSTADVAAFAKAFGDIIAPERYRHARFGLAIRRLSDGEALFERDAQSFFVGASTTKIPTTANALAALGPDFRFHTVVRHTGTIDTQGTLHGDLVLVASGDPNLSARVRDDDTLAFCDMDHSLSGWPGAAAVPGDPLVVLRTLATAVAASGVRRIAGSVRIDVTLFPEGVREGGTSVVVSPIVVNDNLIDVTARAGDTPGDPVHLSASPTTSFVSFVCEAVTTAPGSPRALTLSSEEHEASGARVVRVRGGLPAGTTQLYAHPVESPSAFARTLLVELLEDLGITVDGDPSGPATYLAGPAAFAPAILAEHVSPPFSEAAKIVLKVSQNLHAELCPRVVGAIGEGVRGEGAEAAGYARLAEFLAENDVDADGIVQGDGCGATGYFTPDFMCRLLRAIAAHPIDRTFRTCLPILGRDGTLHDIVPHAAAAGHVNAKTGTHLFDDKLRPRAMILGKGLAGYIEAASGETLVFAAYANNVPLEPGETPSHAGTILGEIAAAAYDLL